VPPIGSLGPISFCSVSAVSKLCQPLGGLIGPLKFQQTLHEFNHWIQRTGLMIGEQRSSKCNCRPVAVVGHCAGDVRFPDPGLTGESARPCVAPAAALPQHSVKTPVSRSRPSGAWSPSPSPPTFPRVRPTPRNFKGLRETLSAWAPKDRPLKFFAAEPEGGGTDQDDIDLRECLQACGTLGSPPAPVAHAIAPPNR